MSSAAAFDYRKIIDSFKAKRLTDTEIEQRLSDLMLLFDFSFSLTRTTSTAEIANLLLLTIMGYTASRRAVFLLQTQRGLQLIEAKGYRSKTVRNEWEYFIPPPYPDYYLCDSQQEGPWKDLCEDLCVQLLVPLQQDDRLLAVIGFGEKSRSRSYAQHELQIVVSLVQMCAGVLENSQTHQTMEFLNRQLTLKIYQLNTLFELSKDFHAAWDSEAIFRILGTSLIGQLLISRCAVFTVMDNRLHLKFFRGLRLQPSDLEWIQNFDVTSLFSRGSVSVLCSELSNPALKKLCESNKVHRSSGSIPDRKAEDEAHGKISDEAGCPSL